MAKRKEDLKKVNFDYLYALAREKEIKITELSQSLGMGKSYISDCKVNGGMKEAHIKIICALYNADYDKLTSVEDKTTKTAPTGEATSYILETLQKLNERVAVLESKRNVMLSDREDVVLLLSQMTKYGQCEESMFKQKAKHYGFTDKLIEFAIEELKCKREVTNGKVWLARKRG